MNEEISNLIRDYADALNIGDIEAVLALYGSEPVFMPQHANALVGRSAVQAGYEHVFKTIKLNIAFTTYEIVELGDTAYARTSSAGQAEILAEKVKVSESNNELFIFRKEQGQWKIHRYIFATTTPRAVN